MRTHRIPYMQNGRTARYGFRPRVEHGGDPWRPNRLAAGMTATMARSRKVVPNRKERLDPDAIRLRVRGTLDALSAGYLFITQGSVCPCCGHRTRDRLRLNEQGKLRLRALRSKRTVAL